MDYIDQNLISGETVTYRAQLHWVILLKPITFAVMVLAIGSTMLYFGLRWSAVSVIAAAAVPLLVGWIHRSSQEFAVTNKRVILKTGILQKKTEEMFLNKIESVGVNQSLRGRMFGYGTIVIRGTGGSLEPFERVSAPLEFRRQIQEQIGRAFGSPGDPSAVRGKPV